MTDVAALLALQQISDSMFPSGAFTHSLGLEQLVHEGRIRDARGVETFVSSVLRASVATSDATATAEAARLATAGDAAGLVALDNTLFATKAAAELRRASTDTGRRLLDEVAPHSDAAVLAALTDEVHAGRSPGTYPVAFGAVAATFGADPKTAAAFLMQGAAHALCQAAMRLFPLSHRDVQAMLHRLRPEIAVLADDALARRVIESFHPLQEIASMRHEGATARMFAS